MSESEADIDAYLENLDTRISELANRCCYASVDRAACEVLRSAKAENRLEPYLSALFRRLNHADAILQPEVGQNAAIEMIGLLESEERARAIQPDFPEGQYANSVYSYSSCAYDNLATATALLKGYNSDGMHACIADGIQVCRRTGKMQCVTCFREYATDVYRAADDLDMAVHFARVGIAHEKPGPHDRRWAGARDLVRLLMLKGDLHAAVEATDIAWGLVETWHNPLNARLDIQLLMREIALLRGEPERWADRLDSQSADTAPPPPGEYPWHEWRSAQVEAVGHSCAGAPARAVELLAAWDRKLAQKRCLHFWMENRIRLLAAHRQAGNDPEFNQLAAELEAKANEARDWLTLRCLERLRSTTANVASIPTVQDLNTKDVSASTSAPSSTSDSAAAADTTATAKSSEKRDPPQYVIEFFNRAREIHFASEDNPTSDSFEQVFADLLTLDASTPRSPEETSWLLNTASMLPMGCASKNDLWHWAEKLAGPHLRDATTLNLLATLGFQLHAQSEAEETLPVELDRIETMFRESLQLDANRSRNFARAADLFLYQENLGEAERCLARGLRLNRSDGQLAMKLAGIYRRTHRQRDALAVLDLCLREGDNDAEVLWEAGITAYDVGSFELAVTYLDACEQQQPGQLWLQYYRAISLLELGRDNEALPAAEEEERRNPEIQLPVAIIRAAAYAGLQQPNEMLKHIKEILATRLAEIDYLTPRGLQKLFELLWKKAAAALAATPDVREQFIDRIVAAGLTPDEVFTADRESRAEVDRLNFYICDFLQPLDDRWANWHGRLAHEADWKSYRVRWGVLATSEEEAREYASAWQKRAFPLPAEIASVEPQKDFYRDKPGIVWQGFREEEAS